MFPKDVCMGPESLGIRVPDEPDDVFHGPGGWILIGWSLGLLGLWRCVISSWRNTFLKHELKPTQRQSWICLCVTTYLSCCSLGTYSGWWTTAGTCSWRPNRWRTAATNETRRSSSASRTSLWSWKQNRQDPRSSVCRLTGLNGSPRP